MCNEPANKNMDTCNKVWFLGQAYPSAIVWPDGYHCCCLFFVTEVMWKIVELLLEFNKDLFALFTAGQKKKPNKNNLSELRFTCLGYEQYLIGCRWCLCHTPGARPVPRRNAAEADTVEVHCHVTWITQQTVVLVTRQAAHSTGLIHDIWFDLIIITCWDHQLCTSGFYCRRSSTCSFKQGYRTIPGYYQSLTTHFITQKV